MKITVIITSFKEPETIKMAVDKVISNLPSQKESELIVVSPDEPTLDSALKEIKLHENFLNYKLIQDKGIGKSSALNLAQQQASGEILIFTDGDMYIKDNSIRLLLDAFGDNKVGGVSGHPISINNRGSQFGFYSHLFCEAAHVKRSSWSGIDSNGFVPMSGYLMAVRNIKGLFPLPDGLKAEDGYITTKLLSMGYKIKYASEALAYVKFPNNLRDWLKQKSRSLGGNTNLEQVFPAHSPQVSRTRGSGNGPLATRLISRNVSQDLKMGLFPIAYSKTLSELWYALLLYPIRTYLWIKIYASGANLAQKGPWERIESTK